MADLDLEELKRLVAGFPPDMRPLVEDLIKMIRETYEAAILPSDLTATELLQRSRPIHPYSREHYARLAVEPLMRELSKLYVRFSAPLPTFIEAPIASTDHVRSALTGDTPNV